MTFLIEITIKFYVRRALEYITIHFFCRFCHNNIDRGGSGGPVISCFFLFSTFIVVWILMCMYHVSEYV